MLQTTHSNAMLDLTASLPNMLFQPHGGRVVDLRTELSRLRPNPLEPLLKRLGQKGSWDWDYTTTSTRFRANYRCYFLSLERSLKVASLETRMRHSGAGFAMKHHLRMTRGEREIARRYHAVSRYASLDLYATLVWARTMLDDVAGLSREFYIGERELPPDKSFRKHRDFFLNRTKQSGKQKEYADYIRTKTGWFDTLKLVRDDFVVHPGAGGHLRMITVGSESRKADLGVVMIREGSHSTVGTPRQTALISIVAIADSIHGFLRWFSDYGIKALDSRVQAKPGLSQRLEPVAPDGGPCRRGPEHWPKGGD